MSTEVQSRYPEPATGSYDSASSISTLPFSTASPGRTRTARTTPSDVERNSFSIFIASMTTRGCPARIGSPASTLIRTTKPGMGATSGAGPVSSEEAPAMSLIALRRSSSASTSNRCDSLQMEYRPLPSPRRTARRCNVPPAMRRTMGVPSTSSIRASMGSPSTEIPSGPRLTDTVRPFTSTTYFRRPPE